MEMAYNTGLNINAMTYNSSSVGSVGCVGRSVGSVGRSGQSVRSVGSVGQVGRSVGESEKTLSKASVRLGLCPREGFADSIRV